MKHGLTRFEIFSDILGAFGLFALVGSLLILTLAEPHTGHTDTPYVEVVE